MKTVGKLAGALALFLIGASAESSIMYEFDISAAPWDGINGAPFSGGDRLIAEFSEGADFAKLLPSDILGITWDIGDISVPLVKSSADSDFNDTWNRVNEFFAWNGITLGFVVGRTGNNLATFGRKDDIAWQFGQNVFPAGGAVSLSLRDTSLDGTIESGNAFYFTAASYDEPLSFSGSRLPITAPPVIWLISIGLIGFHTFNKLSRSVSKFSYHPASPGRARDRKVGACPVNGVSQGQFRFVHGSRFVADCLPQCERKW